MLVEGLKQTAFRPIHTTPARLHVTIVLWALFCPQPTPTARSLVSETSAVWPAFA